MSKTEKLFDQFPPVTTKQWTDKILADLKGADYNKKMVWKTGEGFDVKPFYRMEDLDNLLYINSLPGEFPYLRGTKIKDNNWLVRQNIDVTDYSEANRKALTILMKGIDSLGFILTDPEAVSRENFEILLTGIHIEIIEINFLCNGKAKEILSILGEIASERGLDPDNIKGAVEADPIGRLMVNGKLCVPVEAGFDYLASLTSAAALFPNLQTVHLNASAFSNAGGDIVQELAFGLAMGSEYLTQLTDRNISPVLAASKVRFSFGTGSHYFPEIAKLRAARLLWSVITSRFNPGDRKGMRMKIHCVTTGWNKTIYDPYVNMLRTQTEVMSASLGGADSITVEPFDEAFRKPDEFSERIARNQQLILKEESYFDKVADPSAGSYYIENLTTLIADNAWKLFLEIEENGGFIASLKTGLIQDKIEASASKRKNDLAIRRSILLGTNQYPNNEESVSPSVDTIRAFPKVTDVEDLLVDPVIPFRGAEEFERLRMAVDRGTKRPVVFLLPLGNPVLRKARAQFSAGFFGCGGYNVIDNHGFENIDDGVKQAVELCADIVVICSSDEEYMQLAPEIHARLEGRAITVIAGNPSCTDELKAKGIEHFIHVRSNVAETLKFFNSRLGISL